MSESSSSHGRSRLARLPSQVLYGVAYYAEYQPHDRLERDLDLMAQAGLTVIRVGESVWSTWEPEDGRFDLDWINPVLDGAHSRGIQVVLGTPTYAMPPWLVRKYPEVRAERRTGEPIPYGHRQDACFPHPAFRFHADRVVRQVVTRHRDHPAVIGYQVDNEPGTELFHNRSVFQAFVDDLRDRFGDDVEALNRRWGLVYWSHRISRWDELWAPDGNTVPSYDLAWRRFQADLTTEFIAQQAALVRELAHPDQFVTTCMAVNRPAFDAAALGAALDVAAINPYYAMQDALTLPTPPTGSELINPSWNFMPPGPAAIHLQADMTFGTRRESFLVTETNAMSTGFAHSNFPAFDGQWRQAAWALVARGARMVEYWHWHTNHFGAETYWQGVLNHDGEPGRCYEEVKRIAAELRAAGEVVTDLRPDADVGIVYSPESKWAFAFQPPLTHPGTNAADPASYERIFFDLYAGLFAAGLQMAIVYPGELQRDPADLVKRYPVLILPALYVTDDRTLASLAAYAEVGGHLVIGFRTGYADRDARARAEVMPSGPLREAAGVRYHEYSNLTVPVPVHAAAGATIELPAGAAATAWADGLILEGAKAEVSYEHPHLGRWPALTTREHGRGRVSYLGTLPNPEFARSLGRWLAPEACEARRWSPRPASVTVTGARAPRGQRVRFLSNWSWNRTGVTSPMALRDLLSGETIPAGGSITLGAWDVRILVEAQVDAAPIERRPAAERL
jgi:beta-galactosidase